MIDAIFDGRERRLETRRDRATLFVDEQPLIEFVKIGGGWKLTPPKERGEGGKRD